MPSDSPSAVFVFGINPTRIGGIEVHAREVVLRLAGRGWRVALCFHKLPPKPVSDYLSHPSVSWDVLPNAWENSRQTVSDLHRILRKYRPRLVHFQFTPFLSLFPWIARLHGAKKIFFTDHASRPEGYSAHREPGWKRAVGCWLNRPVDAVVGVSDYNCRTLSTLGTIPPERIHRIYNSADLTRVNSGTGAEFRGRHGIPSDRVLVIQVSSIMPEKGIGDLLQAARLVIRQEPDVHFAFVGEGAHRERFAREAIEMGIGDNVTWAGLVQDPMGEGTFATADIVCQVSRWEEAFGFVIAEAMALGKPLVGTRVGGIPEIVRDGQTGFLAARGDHEAIAEKILLLVRDRALRNRLGAAGRALAEVEFDVRKNADALIRLYGID